MVELSTTMRLGAVLAAASASGDRNCAVISAKKLKGHVMFSTSTPHTQNLACSQTVEKSECVDCGEQYSVYAYWTYSPHISKSWKGLSIMNKAFVVFDISWVEVQ